MQSCQLPAVDNATASSVYVCTCTLVANAIERRRRRNTPGSLCVAVVKLLSGLVKQCRAREELHEYGVEKKVSVKKF